MPELVFRQKNSYQYVYINENNEVSLMMPLMEGRTIGQDNTCRTYTATQIFFDGQAPGEPNGVTADASLQEMITDLTADLRMLEENIAGLNPAQRDLIFAKNTLLVQAQEERLLLAAFMQQPNRVASQRYLQDAMAPDRWVFSAGRSNIFPILLYPIAHRGGLHLNDGGDFYRCKFNRDTPGNFNVVMREGLVNSSEGSALISKGPIDVFKSNILLKYQGYATFEKGGLPLLQKRLKEIADEVYGVSDSLDQSFTNLCPTNDAMIDRLEIKPLTEEWLKVIFDGSAATDDDGEQTEHLYGAPIADIAEMVVRACFSDEHLTEYFKNRGVERSLSILDDDGCSYQDISFLVQFFFAEVNVYCLDYGLSRRDFGEVLEGDTYKYEVLTLIVETKLRGGSMEEALFNYIESKLSNFGISRSLELAEKNEISRKFNTESRVILKSPHTDEFLMLGQRPGGAVKSLGSRMVVPFSAVVQQYTPALCTPLLQAKSERFYALQNDVMLRSSSSVSNSVVYSPNNVRTASPNIMISEVEANALYEMAEAAYARESGFGDPFKESIFGTEMPTSLTLVSLPVDAADVGMIDFAKGIVEYNGGQPVLFLQDGLYFMYACTARGFQLELVQADPFYFLAFPSQYFTPTPVGLDDVVDSQSVFFGHGKIREVVYNNDGAQPLKLIRALEVLGFDAPQLSLNDGQYCYIAAKEVTDRLQAAVAEHLHISPVSADEVVALARREFAEAEAEIIYALAIGRSGADCLKDDSGVALHNYGARPSKLIKALEIISNAIPLVSIENGQYCYRAPKEIVQQLDAQIRVKIAGLSHIEVTDAMFIDIMEALALRYGGEASAVYLMVNAINNRALKLKEALGFLGWAPYAVTTKPEGGFDLCVSQKTEQVITKLFAPVPPGPSFFSRLHFGQLLIAPFFALLWAIATVLAAVFLLLIDERIYGRIGKAFDGVLDPLPSEGENTLQRRLDQVDLNYHYKQDLPFVDSERSSDPNQKLARLLEDPEVERERSLSVEYADIWSISGVCSPSALKISSPDQHLPKPRSNTSTDHL